MKTKRIGFIGLGIMGQGMAANLLKQDLTVTVWNRTPAACESLVTKGATHAECLSDLAEASDIVFVCVTNGAAVLDVLFSEHGLLSGAHKPALVIDCSTIAPAEAMSIAERLAPDTEYLDAPVSGGDTGAREGTLSIMVGGKKPVFEKALPYLMALGNTVSYTGPSGNGQRTKCVNQMMVALTVTAMTEGLAFAAQSGLDLQTTLDVVSAGAAGSWSLSNYAPRLLSGDRAPGFYAADMLKDLRIALQEASDLSLSVPGTALCAELYTALLSSGETELGNHALISLYERISNSVLIK